MTLPPPRARRVSILALCLAGAAVGGCQQDKGLGDDTDDTSEACRSLLVYSTEDSTSGDSYAGVFSKLVTMPELDGWSVEVAERGTAGRLTAAMLEGRGQLWFMGTDRDFDTPPDADEVSAVTAFVGGGGGLLVAADHTDTLYSYSEDVNDIAAPYGVQYSGLFDEATDTAPIAPGAPQGPLVVGVETVPGFSTVGKLEVTDSGVEVAFTLRDSTAVAWRDDEARVVFDRSWLGWSNAHIDEYDQPALLANVLAFLDPC